jgi:hypothetical protein
LPQIAVKSATFGARTLPRSTTVAILVLRLVLAPSTVLAASLVQRRLGPLRGGRLIGLPLTTAPFLLVLCLGSGPAAAARAAAGVVAGQLAVIGFCAAYGHLAARLAPLLTVAAAVAAAVVSAALVGLIGVAWLIAVVVLAAIGAALLTWPAEGDGGEVAARPQRGWELPVRVAVSGLLVAALSTGVHVFGPYLAGVLSTAPVILTVMAPSTHRCAGPGAAARLVRGALATMPASVVFVTVLAYALGPLPAPAAFALALAGLLATDQVTRARRPVRARVTSTS